MVFFTGSPFFGIRIIVQFVMSIIESFQDFVLAMNAVIPPLSSSSIHLACLAKGQESSPSLVMPPETAATAFSLLVLLLRDFMAGEEVGNTRSRKLLATDTRVRPRKLQAADKASMTSGIGLV